MKITLQRLDDAYHFVGKNEKGNEVHIDIAPEEGGKGLGAGPMQMVIMSLGGCSSIDIISILNKARQDVQTFDVELNYERATDQTPAIFTTIHVHYTITGTVDVEKARRAIDLSLNKYCSVSKILGMSATITSSFSINGTHHA